MSRFDFKLFSVDDAGCAMKVGTDSVLLGAWTDVSNATEVLDLGAGSGVLSLMVAQRASGAHIVGIERDNGACKASEYNFRNSPWSERLCVEHADVLDYKPDSVPDLVISNPPYFSNGILSPDARRAGARHAIDTFGPITALRLASDWLSVQGSIAMVTPADYDQDIVFNATMLRLHVWRKCLVSTVSHKPPTRILWQISKDKTKVSTETSMAIRDDGKFTDEYINLTKDFYLNF